MIVRIVKMTFEADKTGDFEAIFAESKALIKNFPGCLHVELLRQHDNPQVYFTYSHWENPEALEAYRHSELFAGVWKRTKALFAAKAEAYSLMNNVGMNNE